MKDYNACEMEVFAAVGELLVSKLHGRDDLANAIFEALLPQFEGRYPYHKILTEVVLGKTKEEAGHHCDLSLLSGLTPAICKP